MTRIIINFFGELSSGSVPVSVEPQVFLNRIINISYQLFGSHFFHGGSNVRPNATLPGHIVGEIVSGFQNDDFEHQHDIEGWSSAVRLRFAQDGEGGSKCFPTDIGGEPFQETVELVEFARVRFGGGQFGLHR